MKDRTKVRTITETQHASLLGIMVTAAVAVRRVEEFERMACAITGEGPGGHTGDEIWSPSGDRPDVDGLLERLRIEVVPDPEPASAPCPRCGPVRPIVAVQCPHCDHVFSERDVQPEDRT